MFCMSKLHLCTCKRTALACYLCIVHYLHMRIFSFFFFLFSATYLYIWSVIFHLLLLKYYFGLLWNQMNHFAIFFQNIKQLKHSKPSIITYMNFTVNTRSMHINSIIRYIQDYTRGPYKDSVQALCIPFLSVEACVFNYWFSSNSDRMDL